MAGEKHLKLSEPLTLPCGLTLPNRLAKAALAENWADKKRLPPKALVDTYALWAEGGWGMVMTGNMGVDVRHLGTPGDTSIDNKVPRDEILAAWRNWAAKSSGNGTPVIVQLNHPGRQSPILAGSKCLLEKSIAPSPVPLSIGDSLFSKAVAALVFGTPREMTKEDITKLVSQFATAAALAAEAGFAGVEIHAAHGYLLSQFLSSAINQRDDEYGSTPRGRAKIVVEVVHAIREAVSAYPKFCIGIKLNSADVGNSQHLEDCIEQFKDIRDAGIDFLEISGGTYEDPKMMEEGVQTKKSESTIQREAFFLEFAKIIREHFLDTPLMVTGGFRTRRGIEAALREGACDLIGIGRPAVLNPLLPKEILLKQSVEEKDAVLDATRVPLKGLAKALGIKGITAGAETAWYQNRMHRMLQAAAQAT